MSLSSDVLGWKVFSPAAIPLARRNTLAFVAITFFAVLWQMRWGTIPDTSWLITVCERMLDGERLYAEVYETNPPFSVWLYMPPVAAAKALGIAPELLVHAGTYLAALCGLLLAGHIVRRAAFPEAARLFSLAPAFYAMLVIYPGNAFTEREHIGAALFLPTSPDGMARANKCRRFAEFAAIDPRRPVRQRAFAREAALRGDGIDACVVRLLAT